MLLLIILWWILSTLQAPTWVWICYIICCVLKGIQFTIDLLSD